MNLLIIQIHYLKHTTYFLFISFLTVLLIWVVMPYRLVCRYQDFRETYCLHFRAVLSFLVYLVTLYLLHQLYSVKWENNEWVTACFKVPYYPSICLEKLGKTFNNLSTANLRAMNWIQNLCNMMQECSILDCGTCCVIL